jgi:hypothetical protein
VQAIIRNAIIEISFLFIGSSFLIRENRSGQPLQAGKSGFRELNFLDLIKIFELSSMIAKFGENI